MIIKAENYAGECVCGKKHELETKLCVVEAGCLAEFDKYLEGYKLSGHRTVVYDSNTYNADGLIRPRADVEVVLNPDGLHANEHGVEALMSKLPESTDLLVAVGSGTIHDITRYCAYLRGVPFVSCPTAASVDGFCSSVAAMTWNGCKKTLTAVAPTLVLADTDVISRAPLYLARSGFGDIIGKYIALADWQIAHLITGEFFCERICDMMRQATNAVMESSRGIVTGDNSAYEQLTYGLLLSGLAMQMMGNSRPASGAEHHISHFIETAPASLGISSDALHGEKVGVATILAADEYHRLEKSKHAWKDYEEFTHEYLYNIFGDGMTEEMEKENQNNSASGIKGESISEHWNEICEILRDIPTADELIKLYGELGVKTTLADIGISDSKKELLLDYSPCVRNRLTLMRLRRSLND